MKNNDLRNLKTDFEKRLNKKIKIIKKTIQELENMSLTLKIETVESLSEKLVNNIYVCDYYNGNIFLQKHLFTIR